MPMPLKKIILRPLFSENRAAVVFPLDRALSNRHWINIYLIQ